MHDVSPASPTENAPGITLFGTDPADPPATSAGWSCLDARALLRVEGRDAETFLQGQLTQDMVRVRAGAALLAAHCSPKGRITALFRAWADGEAFLLDLPGALGAAAQRRLSLYVLRAQVRVSAVGAAWERTGIAGAALGQVLIDSGLPLPAAIGATSRDGDRLCLALGATRWLLVTPAGASAELRARLAQTAGEDPLAWQLACLRDGDPEVLPETVEAFIPQMLNLDLLDGISFRKGCYTGQEIVARAHYLGRVKRRMRAFRYLGPTAPAPGASAVLAASEATPGSAAGHAQIVWAVQSRADGGDALAVALDAQEDAAPAEELPAAPTP